MLRKGRCSNNADKCSLARKGTLLPYAGIGSICPECGAPLALVSSANDESEIVSNPYEENNYASTPDYERHTAPRRAKQQPVKEEKSGALEAAKLGIVFVLVAAGVFLALRYFDYKNNNNESDSAVNSEQPIETSAYQVEEFSEPQVLKTSTAVSAYNTPAQEKVIANIAEGVALDVTGQVNYNGINFYRVNVPYRGGMTGYVIADQLVPVSDSNASGDDSNSPNAIEDVPTTVTKAAEPVISDITERSDSIFYVNSPTANIRDGVGVKAAKVGSGVYGDTLTVNASRTVDGKIWYRVNLPSGGQGWISGSLLSSSKPKPLPKSSTMKVYDTASHDDVTVQTGSNVVINSSQANLRSSAGASGADNIVSKVDKGTVMKVTDTKDIDGTLWLKVHSNALGIDGWVAKATVKPLN